jgi:hypothetical protein
MYKFLLSDVGGEKRFAAAVAKRLALLGALTQGDRRATGQSNALGLGGFDMDNKFGKKALKQMLDNIWSCKDNAITVAPDSCTCETLRLIDAHLTTVLEEVGDDGNWEMGLDPYDDDTDAVQTFYGVMASLLLGPCAKLADYRVAAIREGRSVSKYIESLENGTETKEVIKPKIDAEVQAAKDAGLNFHVLCCLWLYDVGVTMQSVNFARTPMTVPKFLNRCLGMNMSRQKLLTDHFISHLQTEVLDARRSGKYDHGIKTVTGNAVTIEKPRSFCFRGLEAKDERLFVYKVSVDRGMSAETARQLYQENYDESRDYGRNQPVRTGFYIDNRRTYKVPRVYLIINQGAASKRCVIVRPNEGKTTWAIDFTRDKLYAGYRLVRCNDVDRALEKWTQEFNMADVPFSEYYQQFCLGRHVERECIY